MDGQRRSRFGLLALDAATDLIRNAVGKDFGRVDSDKGRFNGLQIRILLAKCVIEYYVKIWLPGSEPQSKLAQPF